MLASRLVMPASSLVILTKRLVTPARPLVMRANRLADEIDKIDIAPSRFSLAAPFNKGGDTTARQSGLARIGPLTTSTKESNDESQQDDHRRP
jgi:hypothetical protein